MSLTINTQRLVTELNQKAYPIAPPKLVPSSSEANTQSINADVQVDLSHLEIIKIIPEENTYGGNNFSSGKSLVNSNDNFIANSNSEKLVEKITSETGEEVQEASDTSR